MISQTKPRNAKKTKMTTTVSSFLRSSVMYGSLPSTAGSAVTLRHDSRGFYYYTTPWGTTRSFGAKRAALAFARRHQWSVTDLTR